MGACASEEERASLAAQQALDKEKARKKAQSRNVDRLLAKQESTAQLVNKLLLLGAGGSGKSTLFKQMITIYGRGFSVEERQEYTLLIHSNIVEAIQTLCQRCEDFGEDVAVNLREDQKYFIALPECDMMMSEAMGTTIRDLWRDPAIQRTYAKRNLFQLSDSASYFFEQVEKVAAPTYIPNEQDVLRSRQRTTGIVEHKLLIDGVEFHIMDVGGQRSERKKWIHCFEHVTAVIFVSGISEYDEVLFEDDKTNRLMESLSLFEEVCNNPWFQGMDLILFLNKRDLFEEKIQKVPLQSLFPEYRGQGYAEAVQHITYRYEQINRSPKRKIYTHVTCAVDTELCSMLFNSVKDMVIKAGLSRAGLM